MRRLCYSAYNDWLHQFCAGSPERLLGVAQLSCEDPEAATHELQRVAKQGVRHVNVLAARATPPVYDQAWQPFWALADETAIPVGFHLAVEVRRTRSDNGVVDSTLRGIMQAMQLMDPIVGLIVTGVLDRHPRLKLVMAESGLSWVPHMIQSLDNQYNRTKQNRLDRGGAAGPELLPSEYFRSQRIIEAQMQGIAETTRQKLLSGNAQALYGL